MSSYVGAGAGDIEQARLAAVARLSGLRVESGSVFGQVAALAARLFGVPMAKITLVDREHVQLLAAYGFDAGDGLIPRGGEPVRTGGDRPDRGCG